MTTQLIFSVDLSKCINCKTCEMACNEYYRLSGSHRRHVVTFASETKTPINLSISCNHCLNPVCVTVCPENNFEKRIDGIVIHHANRCQGCMRCISACPFQAPKLNPHTNRVEKCNFCVERIDLKLKPICLESCITSALGMIEISIEEKKNIEVARHNDEAIISSYTSPSIAIKEKANSLTFFREG